MLLTTNLSNLSASHALFTCSFLFLPLFPLCSCHYTSSGSCFFYQLVAFFTCLHSDCSLHVLFWRMLSAPSPACVLISNWATGSGQLDVIWLNNCVKARPSRASVAWCKSERQAGAGFLVFLTHAHTLVCFLLGASDDAVSCAVMLEVLHSLANQSAPLHHGVVFLFNGAEENILQVKWSDKDMFLHFKCQTSLSSTLLVVV